MELIGKDNQMTALETVYRHLHDEGVFICTLHNPIQRKRLATGEKILRGSFELPGSQRLLLHSYEQYEVDADLIRGVQYFSIFDHKGTLLMERQLNKYLPPHQHFYILLLTRIRFDPG